MAQFKDLPAQVKQFWATRNGQQKALLLGGAVVTLAVIAIFARLLSVPDYKPLFTDMEPADAQKLTAELDAQNIPHQLSADGKTVSVPADKLAAARLQTASQGQPHSGRMGFELFDKVSWGQTEFDEKVAYQRAMEGELEKTIETLADVDSARVHLVMPTSSVFLDRERSGKASVILKLRHDGLSKEAVLAISRLVAGAVDGLKPEDVAIIDADSDRSLGLGQDVGESGEAEETRLTKQLIDTLEPVVGANSVRASVNVIYDQASTEKNEEKYDPSVSALLNMQRTEDSSGGGAAATGVPGASSNIPKADKAKTPAATSPTQSSKSESAQYGVNKTVTRTVTPSGRILRVTAAILVNDANVKKVSGNKTSYSRQPRSAEELAKIRELASAAIGYDASRGDVLSVQNMSFSDNLGDADAPAAKWTMQVQRAMTDYSSVLRPLSLLALFMLTYFLVVRPVQKHALAPGSVTAGMQPALASGNRQALAGNAAEGLDNNLLAAQLKQQTIDMVRLKPADTARALRTWVRGERS